MSVAPEVLLEHAAFVRSIARAALHGDDLVDDVVQDTMLTALEESHRRRGPLRAWLAGIARNKAHNLIRRRAARRRREARVAGCEATEGVDELAARAEEGRRLVAAVLALEVRYRLPILLRYYGGLPPREVAWRLGIPVETARTRIKRGIARLRVDLERTHEREPGGWRVALLPLLHVPARGLDPVPVLLTGGAMLGKKTILGALLLFVLVGSGLWLRPWEHVGSTGEGDEGARLVSDGVDGKASRLRGSPSDETGPSPAWPAPIDIAKIDRDRDLHGFVVRADGSPVPGATVTALYYPWRTLGVVTSYERAFESTEGPSSVSGVDGSFALPLARGDLVHLRVRARGLATTELTSLQSGERVRVVLSEGVRLVVVATTPDGEPATGMPVRFFVSPERTGRWLETTQTTGADGRAVFVGLPAGVKGWLDPLARSVGLGNPGWVEIELPAAGEWVHRLELPPGRTLRGCVVDARTEEPIEGARVSTNWAFLPAVRTDTAGRYELHGWTARLGKTLHAVAKGFVQGAVALTEGVVPDVRLRPGLTLRGHVVDVEQEPVAGALVGVRRIDRAQAATSSLGSDVTDAEGAFEVDGLDATAAQVLVVHRKGLGRWAHVIYPGTGGDLGKVVLPPPCEIRGTVTDWTGAPSARTPVRLTPIEDRGGTLRSLERWTDDLGRFRFPDLGPGVYDLRVGPRFEPTIRRKVELRAERPAVALALMPEDVRSVVVRAVDTEGKPAVGVTFQARAREPAGLERGPHPIGGPHRTGEDGLLTLELPRRPCTLSVVPTVGQGLAIPPPIELDAVQIRVDIVLERLVAIRGRLLTPDEKPIAWGTLSVEGDGDKKQVVQSDENGAFVAYVSSGARVSLAFRGAVQNMERRVNGFVPYTAHVGDVAAGTEDLILRTTALDTNRRLTLRLVDPAGQPVADLRLQIRTPPHEVQPATTASDGRASWVGLPALPLMPRLFSWHASRKQPWIAPTFEPVTPDGQEITEQFRQGAVVEGLVLKEDGTPQAHAFVSILEDDKDVRVAVADAGGRFVAILDPEFKGRVRLRCEVPAPAGKPRLAAVVDVRPGQDPVTLRLKVQN